jgi:hypothetical protein
MSNSKHEIINVIARYLFKHDCDTFKVLKPSRNYDHLASDLKAKYKSKANTLYKRIEQCKEKY